MKEIRKRLTYANVMSTIAVFLVIGGATAVAASQLEKNTVGTKQLKKNAVTGAKVKPNSLTESDLKAGTIPPQVNAYTKSESDARFPTKSEAAAQTASHSYSKGESDARYLRGTITVVKTLAASIPANNFETATAQCPTGYQAIGGGVDPNGVFYGKVSSSGPLVDGQRLHQAADGQHGPANGWYAAITTEGAGVGVSEVKVAVICSPLG